MTLALRPAILHSNRHHSIPVNVDLNLRKDESDSSADGFLMDPYDPEKRIDRRLLKKVQYDELILSLDGEYWQIFIDEQGIIRSAFRASKPKWLDDAMRFNAGLDDSFERDGCRNRTFWRSV